MSRVPLFCSVSASLRAAKDSLPANDVSALIRVIVEVIAFIPPSSVSHPVTVILSQLATSFELFSSSMLNLSVFGMVKRRPFLPILLAFFNVGLRVRVGVKAVGVVEAERIPSSLLLRPKILYHIILYYIMLYHNIPYYIVLYHIILYCIILHYITSFDLLLFARI